VRVGNAASEQFQLDVYGELFDANFHAMEAGSDPDRDLLNIQIALLEWLEGAWHRPDDGIWEVRGPRQHFVHSKVMAWVAFDRAIRACERFRIDNDVVLRWKHQRQEIHDQVCEQGFHAGRGSFTQYYGSDQLDASLLMLALVGFLPPDDPRIVATVEAIQRELVVDGFVLRYATDDPESVDGLPPGEGAFLLTTFWLADNLALMGRRDEAVALFERLRALRNDVDLFSEEYDPVQGRMLGNFPQAFSHLAFIITAASLSLGEAGPVAGRARPSPSPTP